MKVMLLQCEGCGNRFTAKCPECGETKKQGEEIHGHGVVDFVLKENGEVRANFIYNDIYQQISTMIREGKRPMKIILKHTAFNLFGIPVEIRGLERK